MGGYFLRRGVALFLALTVGLYLTIFIAGMGGYMDKIIEADVRFKIAKQVQDDPKYQHLSPQEKHDLIEQLVGQELERLGLDKPFYLRSLSHLGRALTLNLGRAMNITSDSGSKLIANILLERLPSTLVLFSTASLLLFFATLFAGLYLSRRYGSFLDRLSVALAPTSAAPGWFYGIILILIFAAMLKLLPFGGMVDAPPPKSQLGYLLSVGKHMVLPVLAMFLSAFFIGVYNRRTFFLIFSSEDYVELGRAKGVSSRALERRYILRPTLPVVITDFALMLIVMWMGAIILEKVFNWPGLGSLYYEAVQQFEIGLVVGETAIYAYLLALTILALDIVYAIVDPRVKMSASSTSA